MSAPEITVEHVALPPEWREALAVAREVYERSMVDVPADVRAAVEEANRRFEHDFMFGTQPSLGKAQLFA